MNRARSGEGGAPLLKVERGVLCWAPTWRGCWELGVRVLQAVGGLMGREPHCTQVLSIGDPKAKDFPWQESVLPHPAMSESRFPGWWGALCPCLCPLVMAAPLCCDNRGPFKDSQLPWADL